MTLYTEKVIKLRKFVYSKFSSDKDIINEQVFTTVQNLNMTFSREVKQQIVTLHQHTPKSQRETATELGISRKAVQKAIGQWEETASLENHYLKIVEKWQN